MVRRWVLVLVLIIIGGLVPDGQAQAQETAGPLEGMLSQVPDNQVSRTIIWYGSLGDLEKVLGLQLSSYAEFQALTPQQQFAYQVDLGKQVYYSPFSGVEYLTGDWRKAFGIDPFTVDRELTVGVAPQWYDILQGRFTKSGIIQALQNLGYKESAGVYSLGSDGATSPNAQVAKLAAGHYNRLVIADQQVIAAPSTAMIQAATSGSKKIGADPAYVALVRTMEDPTTIADTTLLSAALYNGPYLSDKVITANTSANDKLLPRYQTAGLGYRRDQSDYYWIIALVYPDANTANQAKATLADRLGRYQSLTQNGRQLFDGWKIDVTVVPSNNLQVVVASMQMPAQTDVALVDVLQTHDLGFLATAAR